MMTFPPKWFWSEGTFLVLVLNRDEEFAVGSLPWGEAAIGHELPGVVPNTHEGHRML